MAECIAERWTVSQITVSMFECTSSAQARAAEVAAVAATIPVVVAIAAPVVVAVPAIDLFDINVKASQRTTITNMAHRIS